MKDKLYDFLCKHNNLFMFLVIATPIFGVTGAAIKNEPLTQAAVVVMVLCIIASLFLECESTRRSHKKSWQLLQDQRNSSSPHWDGNVRYPEDIEPRLRLLRNRMAQDQAEVDHIERVMKS